MDATRPVALVVPAPPNVAAPFRPSSPPGKEGMDYDGLDGGGTNASTGETEWRFMTCTTFMTYMTYMTFMTCMTFTAVSRFLVISGDPHVILQYVMGRKWSTVNTSRNADLVRFVLVLFIVNLYANYRDVRFIDVHWLLQR